jgi:hypothetical protein
MVNLFRDVPLKWLVHVAGLLDRLDRLDILKETIQFSQTHTFQKYVAQQPTKLVNLADSTLAQSINTMFQAQQQIVVQQAQKRSQANLSLFAGLSWQRIRTQAEELVTLDDLSSGVHGRSDVAKRANQELDDIAQVASCLYSLFGEVVPAIRLDWAERLSQFDSPVNLRNLSSLPRWRDPQIEYLQRQAMQSLVDWFYQRVDVGQPEAVAMMNDLVRVCILLASQAPVNQIIAGHVQEAATVRPGDEVKIKVPLGKIHIGMHVLIYNQDRTEVIAQGVVQDIAEDQVGARITKAKDAIVQLAKDAQVQFGNPAAFSKNPLISKAIHDGNFTIPIF